jgi:hypothetical protein
LIAGYHVGYLQRYQYTLLLFKVVAAKYCNSYAQRLEPTSPVSSNVIEKSREEKHQTPIPPCVLQLENGYKLGKT